MNWLPSRTKSGTARTLRIVVVLAFAWMFPCAASGDPVCKDNPTKLNEPKRVAAKANVQAFREDLAAINAESLSPVRQRALAQLRNGIACLEHVICKRRARVGGPEALPKRVRRDKRVARKYSCSRSCIALPLKMWCDLGIPLDGTGTPQIGLRELLQAFMIAIEEGIHGGQVVHPSSGQPQTCDDFLSFVEQGINEWEAAVTKIYAICEVAALLDDYMDDVTAEERRALFRKAVEKACNYAATLHWPKEQAEGDLESDTPICTGEDDVAFLETLAERAAALEIAMDEAKLFAESWISSI